MSKSPLCAPAPLGPAHSTDRFNCGVETLNEYLKKYARVNNANGSAKTYAALRGGAVAGYYTLTVGSVRKETAPRRVGKGLANHPVPVIIIARLAVDKTEQGAGLGSALMRDALSRIHLAAESIGGRAVLVHAKDEEARSFYEQFGFERSPIDQFHLYLLLKDIEKTLQIL